MTYIPLCNMTYLCTDRYISGTCVDMTNTFLAQICDMTKVVHNDTVSSQYDTYLDTPLIIGYISPYIHIAGCYLLTLTGPKLLPLLLFYYI